MSAEKRVCDLGCGITPIKNWLQYGLMNSTRKLLDGSYILNVDCVDQRDDLPLDPYQKNDLQLNMHQVFFDKFFQQMLQSDVLYDVILYLYPYGYSFSDFWEPSGQDIIGVRKFIRESLGPGGFFLIKTEIVDINLSLMDDVLHKQCEIQSLAPDLVEDFYFDSQGLWAQRRYAITKTRIYQKLT